MSSGIGFLIARNRAWVEAGCPHEKEADQSTGTGSIFGMGVACMAAAQRNLPVAHTAEKTAKVQQQTQARGFQAPADICFW